MQPGHTIQPLRYDDGKSVLCKLIQIIGDCVFLSYSPKLVSELIGCTTSFVCCLSLAPRGAQKHGTDMPIKAIMKTEVSDDRIMQASKQASEKARKRDSKQVSKQARKHANRANKQTNS